MPNLRASSDDQILKQEFNEWLSKKLIPQSDSLAVVDNNVIGTNNQEYGFEFSNQPVSGYDAKEDDKPKLDLEWTEAFYLSDYVTYGQTDEMPLYLKTPKAPPHSSWENPEASFFGDFVLPEQVGPNSRKDMPISQMPMFLNHIRDEDAIVWDTRDG